MSFRIFQSAPLWKALTAVAVVTCVGMSLILLVPRLLAWSVLPDFTVFWAAGKMAVSDPARVYDAAALTNAQSWAVSPQHGLRPFPYRPTALLLFIPLALLPFWVAYWCWVSASAVTFWIAARHLVRERAAALSMFTPHVVLVLILGQTTLIVGSLIIWAVIFLQERPRLAGTLLAIAAVIKPQSVLLAPVALVSGRHWQAFVASAAVALAIGLGSLVLGLNTWASWAAGLSAFPNQLTSMGVIPFGATPWMMGRNLNLGASPLLIVQIGGILIGVAAVWQAFRTNDAPVRASMLVFGGLLASPYALRYDLATAAPVLCLALLSGTPRGLLVSVPLFALRTLAIVPAIFASVIAQLAVGPSPRKADAQPTLSPGRS